MDLDQKRLKQIDPLHPQGTVDFDAQKGSSPFDPPDEYAQPVNNGVTPENMHPYLRTFVEEHAQYSEHLARLESLVAEIRREGEISEQRFAEIKVFFDYFDSDVVGHNRREERELFPILRRKMLERGEHSCGPNPVTPVSVLEGEHIEAVRISALAMGFSALAYRLQDPASKGIVLSIAVERCEALIKMLRLHMFREDRIAFALAQEFLSEDELESLARESDASNPTRAVSPTQGS